MGEYLIQKTTLTGIADAIRERAGVTAPIFPAAMPGYIRGIRGTESDSANVPDDIVAEAERVAEAMLPRVGANAVTFLAMADMHQPCAGDIADATILERTQRGNRNAGQGAKLVSDKVALDFFVNLGDLTFGSSTTTIQGGTEAIASALRYTAGVMEANETFCTPGNHDPMTTSFSQNGTYLGPELMAGLIGTYRLLDLEEKKVRVICMNTADNEGAEVAWSESTERLSAGQLQWFAESLDLSGKEDAGEWKIILLSHHPLDWGNIRAAGNCLGAYLAGQPFSITHNGTEVSYDYTGKNMAQVIAQFHGHTHCLKVDYIHDNSSGAPVATSVKRLAIPNAYFYRNNEYATGENYGLVFGEEATYEKSDDSTGKNTAFCLVSIDLDAQVIYADCFGAGYDRVVSFGVEEIVTYSVTNILTAAVNSNGAATVVEGEAYAASITASDGYALESVTVTMGGEDVTASVYSGGAISIPAVTGDVVITAVATLTEEPSATNLVPTSIDTDGSVYNGTGYKLGCRLNSSGTETALDGAVASGVIPYAGQTLKVSGSASSEPGTTGNYVALYDGSFTKLYTAAFSSLVEYGAIWAQEDEVYVLNVNPASLTHDTYREYFASAAYIRCSLAKIETPEDFVVTLE